MTQKPGVYNKTRSIPITVRSVSSQSFRMRMRLNTTLLVLASLFLLQGNSTFLIRANITSNALDSNVVASQQFGGGSPPAPRTKLSGCGCKRILISSLGPAAHYQPQAMGIYEA